MSATFSSKLVEIVRKLFKFVYLDFSHHYPAHKKDSSNCMELQKDTKYISDLLILSAAFRKPKWFCRRFDYSVMKIETKQMRKAVNHRKVPNKTVGNLIIFSMFSPPTPRFLFGTSPVLYLIKKCYLHTCLLGNLLFFFFIY